MSCKVEGGDKVQTPIKLSGCLCGRDIRRLLLSFRLPRRRCQPPFVSALKFCYGRKRVETTGG